MPKPKDLDIAYQLAPVFVQKVNEDNPRGDFITRVDYTNPGDLRSLLDNWTSVNAPAMTKSRWEEIVKDGPPYEFNHNICPYVYYSIVETHTHYFVVYAAYHPQDWEDPKTIKNFKGPRYPVTEHIHDMEGALVVARKKDGLEGLRADVMITISHWDFYSFANWRLINKDEITIPVFQNGTENQFTGVPGFKREDLDGNLWAIWHKDEDGGLIMRPKLYVQAKGHGIKGDKRGWTGGNREIRYCPSLKGNDEPVIRISHYPTLPPVELIHKNSLNSPESKDKKITKDVYRYELLDIFAPGGLWENRDTLEVFQKDRGVRCFAVRESFGSGELKAGSAKPPWSWDDINDHHKKGDMAIDPARLVRDYIQGFDEFSLEYVSNKYQRI
jgi:hypothetical protein